MKMIEEVGKNSLVKFTKLLVKEVVVVFVIFIFLLLPTYLYLGKNLGNAWKFGMCLDVIGFVYFYLISI